MSETRLGDNDPTVFAKCPRCCVTGPGAKQGNYFAKAYTRNQWKRGQSCENCGFLMAFVREIK
jgi:hypothetical protein